MCYLLTCTYAPAMEHTYNSGQWKGLPSYYDAVRVEVAGLRVFTLANGSLYAYDTEDGSLNCYSKQQPLSDCDIAHIKYDSSSKTLVVVYANGNIDLLGDDDSVVNLPQLMEKNMTQAKGVNDICIYNRQAFLSTDFGIVVVNIDKGEFGNTYTLNEKVNSCTICGGNIYTATQKGVLTAKLTDNLKDVDNWKKIISEEIFCVSTFKKRITGLTSDGRLIVINNDNNTCEQLLKGRFSTLRLCGETLTASDGDKIYTFSNIDKYTATDAPETMADVALSGNTYWTVQHENGLNAWTLNSNTNQLVLKLSHIAPDSPASNFSCQMIAQGESLLVAGGGADCSPLQRKGAAMVLSDGRWTNLMPEDDADSYEDITSIAQDPRDCRRVMVASARGGLYEFYDGKLAKRYTAENTTLESRTGGGDGNVWVSGLTYDAEGNLWVVNNGRNVVDNLHVLTVNNEWKALSFSELTGRNNLSRSMVDSAGRLWITSACTDDGGLFCLDTNGSPTYTDDDQYRYASTLTDQDGASIAHKGVFCATEDKDGDIWIGTGCGPVVLRSPANFLDESYHCQRIKIERDDDTGLADFLLNNNKISDIAIDPANRKWVATEGNGLFLLTADGEEALQHFTADNSPLPSDTITALALAADGTLYVGTSKGMAAYTTDSPEGEAELSKDKVYAYPNPVRADYGGMITIKGLMNNTNVKIVNLRGDLVNEGTSTGGLYTWNGRNSRGERVATGVYMVLATDSEGSRGVACKIMIIR
jgi:hypothetical protein